MAFDNIYVKDVTSVIIQVMLRDSTTGMGKTGVTYSALTASYCRPGGTRTAITPAAGAPGDAYSSGKFAEVDSTNMPGLYQFHVPNAALATGANSSEIALKYTGVLDKSLKIVLIDANLRDAVRLGLTALPNAAAEAAGGLFTRGSGAGQINQAANGQIDVDIARVLNTAVTAATAGVMDVNVSRINNVAATSVTAVNANQGTTQPINFQGTGASAYVKGDLRTLLGTAVSAPATAGIMDVNVKNIANAAVSTSTAQIGVNAVNVGGTAQRKSVV